MFSLALCEPFGVTRSEMNRLFDNFLGSPLAEKAFKSAQRSFPAVNVWEDEAFYFVEAECPGCKIDSLDVSVRGEELTIKGTRTAADNPSNSQLHRSERGTGAFSRTLMLPNEVEANKVEASLKHGVLTIKMPKAEAAKPRKIAIKN